MFSQNKYDMSVTPPVSQVEMCPYVASAVVASASHAVTALLIFQLTMTLPVRETSQSPVLVSHITPHDVDSHGVLSNAPPAKPSISTSSSKHQPRSWSKAEAEMNMDAILVTLSTAQSLRS